MKSKIFISLNIPEKTKKKLVLATEKWRELPIKWIRKVNLHITLVFLGLVSEEAIFEICKKVRTVAEKENIFDIDFSQIKFFPSADDPKLVALTGKPSEELKNLVNSLEKELGISNALKKSFSPHITLGRVRKYKWEALKDKPSVSEKFPLIIDVKSVDVMSSKFSNQENRYSILDSCPLQ